MALLLLRHHQGVWIIYLVSKTRRHLLHYPLSGFFGSIFPPVPSTGVGKERRQDFGDQASMYGSPSFSDNKGENKTSKASNMYQNEATDPCNLSSSIYYGGQENYSPRTGTTESHQHHTSKKDGSEDDANSASRGNWWQGSLYY
ncbi:hypothetical protein FF1_001476 [Malus domestica]